MLVKHNLSQETQFYKSIWRSTGVTHDICDLQTTDNEISFIFNKDFNGRAVFGSTLAINENSYGFVLAENKGTLPFSLTGVIDKILKPGEKIIIKIDNEGSTFWVNILSEYNYVGQLQKLKISQFMVSDEPVDIYLPHKENLPEDKQPLLPPEGDYKGIEPVRG